MAEISLQEYLQEIDDAIDQGRYDEALAHGRHILQHYPKYLPAYRLLGKAMLEAGRDDLAEDMFRRVLSGDPEDFVARVGMSIIADRRGDLQRAIWHMERAFELAPNNEAIQEELRRLYGRRDGVEPARLQLTRAGLARLYLRGNLFSRAIDELRALLAQEPDRVDLWVTLAEALWRNDQRVQAEEACLRVLDELPYCLKAHLILGEIWTRSGREEGRTHLEVAEALDPEHREAVKLLGDASPLRLREIRLPHLEYVPPEATERPAWMAAAGVEGQPAEEERALVDLEAETEALIEIPSWLQELGEGEEAEEGVAPSPAPAEEEQLPVEEAPQPEEEEAIEVPEWLLEEPAGAQMAEEPGPEGEAGPEEEIPEWLRGLGEIEGMGETAGEVPAQPLEMAPPSEGAPPAEVPEWLLGEERTGGAEETPTVEPPVPAEIPDWLKEMAPPEVRGEAQGPAPTGEEVAGTEAPPLEEEQIPEWLAEEAEAPTAEGAEEIPAWLAEVAPSVEEAGPVEEGGAPAEEAGVPSWLEGEGLPSGDEALAWLESLAAGKEEELRAAAAAEAEARMAEIMGRPQEEAGPPPPAEPEVPPVEEAGPPVEEEVEVPEWLVAAAAPEPTVAPEPEPPVEAPGLEELAPPEVPRAEVPPAEPEAFGWTAFGVEEEVPPEPVPPEAVPPAEEEGFGWTEFEGEPTRPVEGMPAAEQPAGEAAVAPEIGPPPEVSSEELVISPAPEAPVVPGAPEAEAVREEAEEVAPPPVEEAAPPVAEKVVVEVEQPAEGLEGLREYVRAHPRDHQARLELARELWRAGLYADSLEAYSRLLRSGKQVEEVMADMEVHLQERPSDPAVRRVLGDAYMRAGRLAEALEIYREALESL